MPGVPPGGGGKRPSTALIAGIAGAAVVIIGIVVVLVIVLGGEKKPASGGNAGGGATTPASTSPDAAGNAQQAAGILVGQASIPPVEYQCVVDALEGDSALAGAVVGGTADSTAVADLVMSCVSSGTIADVVTKDLAGQYPAGSVACLNTNIASLDQASLSSLLQAIYEGNVQAAQSIVGYAASGC